MAREGGGLDSEGQVGRGMIVATSCAGRAALIITVESAAIRL